MYGHNLIQNKHTSQLHYMGNLPTISMMCLIVPNVVCFAVLQHDIMPPSSCTFHMKALQYNDSISGRIPYVHHDMIKLYKINRTIYESGYLHGVLIWNPPRNGTRELNGSLLAL
jgi:hypothetical protein